MSKETENGNDLSYEKIFDPERVATFAGGEAPEAEGRVGDRGSRSVYVYADQRLVLAVNVALATGRPLLLRGPSGAGKSSLARNVAECLGRRYYEEVITSRTQARDLQWRFDSLRRLSDAQAGELDKEKGYTPYIEPGVLWWAFERERALRRGLPEGAPGIVPAQEPYSAINAGRASEPAVVLLDEIDKADPDVPNNLLVQLGSFRFTIPEIGASVEASQDARPLVIITTNDERELPGAFLRRCIIFVLPQPGVERLVEIAKAHFSVDRTKLFEKVAEKVAGAEASDGTAQPLPSTAEYLDAIEACLTLGVDPEDDQNKVWAAVASATLWKPRQTLDEE